jgi:hypothetical protein
VQHVNCPDLRFGNAVRPSEIESYRLAAPEGVIVTALEFSEYRINLLLRKLASHMVTSPRLSSEPEIRFMPRNAKVRGANSDLMG